MWDSNQFIALTRHSKCQNGWSKSGRKSRAWNFCMLIVVVFLIQGCIYNLIERTWPNKKSHPISGIFMHELDSRGGRHGGWKRMSVIGALLSGFCCGKTCRNNIAKNLFRSVIPSTTKLAYSQNFVIWFIQVEMSEALWCNEGRKFAFDSINYFFRDFR